MTTTTKKTYEAMFLVDSALAGSDWDGTLAAIQRVLERADAEVLTLRKWADRKLAYEIDHKGRGTYILSYFKADGSKIAGLEKDVQLSEQIMRVLVLGTEGRPQDVLEKDISGESQAPRGSDEDRSGDEDDDSEDDDNRDDAAMESRRQKRDDTATRASANEAAVETGAEDESMEASEASDTKS